MDSDVFSTKLSERTTKKLFFNAEKDTITQKIFQTVQNIKVERQQEVRPEEKPIDPFEAINKRNAELDQIRFEASKVPDPMQIMIKEPSKPATSVETVKLEDLPIIVRQAAEASILAKLSKRRQ